MNKYIKIFLSLIVGLLLCLSGCSTVKYIPLESETKVQVKDSTIINIRDSVRIIPIERYVDLVPDTDTLYLETSLAYSKSWVENNQLKGRIENKKGIEQHIQKTEIVKMVSDTVFISKPVPVEIEKVVEVPPKSMKFFVGWFIGSLLLAAVLLLVRLRG